MRAGMRILSAIFLLGCSVSATEAGWIRQNSVTKRILYSACFIDTARGWAVGEAVIRTTDGGQHWTVLIDSTDNYWSDVSFTDSLHGWSVMYNPLTKISTVFATTDCGLTWQEQKRDTEYQLTGVKFVSITRGYVAGGYTDDSGFQHSEILTTTDGGISWRTYVISDSTSRVLNAVDAIGPSHAWAVGWGDSFCLSRDGGSTWFSRPSSGHSIYEVSFGDLRSGWGVNWEGHIRATTDSGMTWNLQLDDTTILMSVSAVDSLHVWASGFWGTLWATRDGGRNWQRQSTGYAYTLLSVAFVDSLHGWAVSGGPDSLILHTDDGGWEGIEMEPTRESTTTNLKLAMNTPLGEQAQVRFAIPKDGDVRLELYDAMGRKVETWIKGWTTSGWHEMKKTIHLPAGVYFAYLRSNHQQTARKVVILQ